MRYHTRSQEMKEIIFIIIQTVLKDIYMTATWGCSASCSFVSVPTAPWARGPWCSSVRQRSPTIFSPSPSSLLFLTLNVACRQTAVKKLVSGVAALPWEISVLWSRGLHNFLACWKLEIFKQSNLMIPLTSQCNKSSKHQNQDERGILVYTLGLYINISHPQSQFLVIVTCLRAYKEVWIGCTQTHPPHPHSPKLNAHDVSEPSGLFWHFFISWYCRGILYIPNSSVKLYNWRQQQLLSIDQATVLSVYCLPCHHILFGKLCKHGLAMYHFNAICTFLSWNVSRAIQHFQFSG